jgi:hypothetical protein
MNAPRPTQKLPDLKTTELDEETAEALDNTDPFVPVRADFVARVLARCSRGASSPQNAPGFSTLRHRSSTLILFDEQARANPSSNKVPEPGNDRSRG